MATNKFYQFHILTSFPASNLNRDELGRPKSLIYGGVERLRISSQSLKRNWRTSDVFSEALEGKIGVRTKKIGTEFIKPIFDSNKVSEKDSKDWIKRITQTFGKVDDNFDTSQLVHYSNEELDLIKDLAIKVATEKRAPKEEELRLLQKTKTSVDISLFGRMLADSPSFNFEAACQVAHAFSVNGVSIESDYFTAVDDLKNCESHSGAAHIGESGFGAGIFYCYICIDSELLVKNLGGDKSLSTKAIKALLAAATTVQPKGKQNSFGSRAYASYVMAEKGKKQPRSLAIAFLKPIKSGDQLTSAIEALRDTKKHFDLAYDECSESFAEMNVLAGNGTITDILSIID